jgi:hypothetical protein
MMALVTERTMADTNAERQRRYIARLKAAASDARVHKLEAQVARLKAENAKLRATIKSRKSRHGEDHESA